MKLFPDTIKLFYNLLLTINYYQKNINIYNNIINNNIINNKL